MLQIVNAGDEEFGEYECVSRNEAGQASARVNVVKRPDENNNNLQTPRVEFEVNKPSDTVPSVVLESKEIEVNERDTARLDCATSYTGPYRIDWSSPSGEYLNAQSDGSLLLADARLADSGYYTCTVTNRHGSARDQVYLRVVNAADSPNSPRPEDPTNPADHHGHNQQQSIRVQISPKSRTVSRRGQAEFVCEARDAVTDKVLGGDNELSVRWSRAGGVALPRAHQANGNVLRLTKVREGDGGRYQCTVQARSGAIDFDAAYLSVSKPVDKNR